MSTLKGKTTKDNILLTTEEIRKVLYAQKKFNCTLKCAYRSVIRHWPNELAWEDEIKAKMNRPCVMAFSIPSEQKGYTTEFLANFYPPQGSFPFFASKNHMVDSGDVGHHTWGQVKEIMNTRQVYWIFVLFPLTITRSATNYELLYQHAVVKEGIREILGFSTAQDDLLPLLDYFSARNAGTSAETLARCFLADAGDCAEGDVDYLSEWPSYLRQEMQNPCLIRYQAMQGVLEDGEGLRSPCRHPPASPPRPRINLFGNDPATSITLRRNKASVQQTLKAHGLNYIRSIEAWSACEAIERAANAIYLPVVVKPACGTGSAFVTLCHTERELHNAFRVWEAQKVSGSPHTSPMVVEEYIDGEEYVVDTVSFEGRHVVTDVWRSWKYPKKLLSTRLGIFLEQEIMRRASDDPNVAPPAKVETLSLLYDRLEFVHNLAELPPEGDERQVVDYTLKCIDVLGMRNGCSHCELRIDRRKSSPNFGKPVLIELNPRMQGDVPRSTELVGYDQFTLLVYLSAAAAAFSPMRNQVNVDQDLDAGSLKKSGSKEVPSSLPWPPAPQLYRSIASFTGNKSKPITRHVIFFCAEKYSILFELGAAKVKNLPTYLRHARGNLFSFLNVWQAVYVSQTVDLFSSPGACVLQGTEDEIRRDTEIIRRMEKATIPSSILCLSRRLVESIKAAQAMNLQLYMHGKCRFSEENQFQDASKAALPRSPEGELATVKFEPELDVRMSNYAEQPCIYQNRLHNLNAENERMYAEWVNSLLELKYPPLFVSEEDFFLFQAVRSSWNAMIPYSGEQNVGFSDFSAPTASEKDSCFIEVAKRLNYFF